MTTDFSENFFFQSVKCAVVSTVICVLFAVILAAVAGIFSVSSAAVKIIGSAAKILVLFLGSLICLHGEKRLLKGVLAGVVFAFLTYCFFAAISSSGFSSRMLLSLLLGAVAGGAAGLLSSFVKGR